MATDLLYGLLPEHLLLALICVLMVLDMLGGSKRLAGLLFVLALSGGCCILAWQLGQGYAATLVPAEIVIDRFGLLARLVMLGCGLVYGLWATSQLIAAKQWLLLAASLLGALIILDSAGFVSLFIGIELLSLPAFALMVCSSGSAPPSEGAFKYLLLSSVASALILFGTALAYGGTGTLAIQAFATALASGGARNLAAGSLILCGFFLKAAVFPFHAWAPDAYAGARLPVTAFLASIIKGAVVLGLVRVVAAIPFGSELVTAVTVLSLASIFYGNVAAIRQTTFKRLLAYSSIAHAGYMMFALTDTTGDRLESLLYYVAAYAVTTIVASACYGQLCTDEGEDLEALRGSFSRRPIATTILALAVLSMAGIPPLPGFLAKLLIFKSVIASGLLLPAVLAFIGSYLGTVFYLGIVLRLFGTEEPGETTAGTAAVAGGWGGIVFGSVLFIALLLVPGIFHRLLALV